MPVTNDSLKYEDVRLAMDAALENPIGVKVEMPTKGLAVNFRQRCWRYNKNKKQLSMQTLPEDDPDFGFSAYDGLFITCEGNFVIIRRRDAAPPKVTILDE